MKYLAMGLFFGVATSGFAGQTVTPAELAKHNNVGDCWMVIEGSVYSMTNSMALHAAVCKDAKLADFCGKDATSLWKSKESGDHQHKKKSLRSLENAKVGPLEHTP
jgi:cytochrome b involved in lipid metabolism